MINLYQLNIFITVVEEGNFSAAAKKLHMTQPAVSLQIKGLEERYQMRLFERQGQRLVATERARALIAPARELLAAAQHTEQTLVSHEQRELSGQLTLAVAVEGRRWPALLAAFQQQHPLVTIAAARQAGGEALAGLRAGRSELALLAEAPANKQFDALRLRDDELVAVVPADHAWADGGQALPLTALREQALVLPLAGSDMRLAIEDALEEWGLNRRELRPVLELDRSEDVALAVEAGVGLGFISRQHMSARTVMLTQPFGEGEAARQLTIPLPAYLVRLRHANHIAVAAAFWQYVEGELKVEG